MGQYMEFRLNDNMTVQRKRALVLLTLDILGFALVTAAKNVLFPALGTFQYNECVSAD
jgi:hypothetical protein